MSVLRNEACRKVLLQAQESLEQKMESALTSMLQYSKHSESDSLSELGFGSCLLLALISALSSADLTLSAVLLELSADYSPLMSSRHFVLWLVQDYTIDVQVIHRALEQLSRIDTSGLFCVPGHMKKLLQELALQSGIHDNSSLNTAHVADFTVNTDASCNESSADPVPMRKKKKKKAVKNSHDKDLRINLLKLATEIEKLDVTKDVAFEVNSLITSLFPKNIKPHINDKVSYIHDTIEKLLGDIKQHVGKYLIAIYKECITFWAHHNQFAQQEYETEVLKIVRKWKNSINKKCTIRLSYPKPFLGLFELKHAIGMLNVTDEPIEEQVNALVHNITPIRVRQEIQEIVDLIHELIKKKVLKGSAMTWRVFMKRSLELFLAEIYKKCLNYWGMHFNSSKKANRAGIIKIVKKEKKALNFPSVIPNADKFRLIPRHEKKEIRRVMENIIKRESMEEYCPNFTWKNRDPRVLCGDPKCSSQDCKLAETYIKYIDPNMGFGLFACEPINEGDTIIGLIGDISLSQSINDPNYCASIGKDINIDLTIKGNMARYINHSERPNSIMNKALIGGFLTLVVRAVQPIKKDEQITSCYDRDVNYNHECPED